MSHQIIATHIGSLPRPEQLAILLDAEITGNAPGPELDAALDDAVTQTVAWQAGMGLDQVSDGEQDMTSFMEPGRRLSGYSSAEPGTPLIPQDVIQTGVPFASGEYFAAATRYLTPRNSGPVSYRPDLVTAKIARLKAALATLPEPPQAFMSAPSPAMIAGLGSSHYAAAADLLRAVAEAMSHEYRAIADAGFIVSVDAPDLTTGFHTWNYGTSVAQYREIVTAHVEALNHALRQVPPEQVRLHLCYGNYAGPHHMDIGLADVIDILYTARARTLAVGLANPRHRGDWRVFRDHPLPAGWMLCAGAVDTLSPVAESPEAVSDILVRLAGIVGAERLQAAPDCGFASFHRLPAAEATTRLKLAALVEGAHLASASV